MSIQRRGYKNRYYSCGVVILRTRRSGLTHHSTLLICGIVSASKYYRPFSRPRRADTSLLFCNNKVTGVF